MRTFLLSLVLAASAMAQLPPEISDLQSTVTSEQLALYTKPVDNHRIVNLYFFYGGNLCYWYFHRDGSGQWLSYASLFTWTPVPQFIEVNGTATVNNGFCAMDRAVSSEQITSSRIDTFMTVKPVNLPNVDVEVYSITDYNFNYRKFTRTVPLNNGIRRAVSDGKDGAKPAAAEATPTEERTLSWSEGWTELGKRINQGYEASRVAQ